MDIIDSEKLIIELNFRNEIVDEKNKAMPFDSRKMFHLLPATIIDKRTLQAIEIHDLFAALDHSFTYVGKAKLFHSLMNPPASLELIHAKHDSFCELESCDRLREAIVDYLNEFAKGEKALFKMLNAHMHPLMAYTDLKKATQTVAKMQKAVDSIQRPETVYLDSLLKSIQSFNGSPVSSIVKGSTYRTFGGVKTRDEKGFFTPSLRFRPSRVSFGSILPALPGAYFGAAWLFHFMNPAMAQSLFYLTCGGSLLGVLYGTLLKPMFDYETAILSIRRRFLESNRFASAIEAVAAIDELLSFITYAQELNHPAVLPVITNTDRHYFVAKEMRNPIMAKSDQSFVANEVALKDSHVTFITGPNSGGKTTFCKTIVQNQILGQIGAPVAASSAKMNMADKITYQAPAFDTLNDPEGRFGTELKVTRDIFFNVTPKSLTILDEIAEGTTTHEKISLSMDIMNGFYSIGGNTLLVTHSFELVEHFRKQHKGQYLQVEFVGEEPTHKVIPGISKESHAHRVAAKIGFSPEDIERYLREKKYLVHPQAEGHSGHSGQ
jgi:DNA mismatch repair protein MutS